jgi:hypothetical protein
MITEPPAMQVSDRRLATAVLLATRRTCTRRGRMVRPELAVLTEAAEPASTKAVTTVPRPALPR